MEKTFAYKALDRDGGDVTGFLEAASERAAMEALSAKGLSPYDVKARTETKLSFLPAREKASASDLSRYLKQLSTLLTANVPIADALGSLARSKAHPLLAAKTEEAIFSLRAGKKLSAALSESFPEFPPYVAKLADLGEATGSLSKALSDAADRMERELKTRAEIRSALTYPAFLFVFGGLIILLMFAFVVPRFATLLGDNLSEAPAISRMVIGTGIWFQANWAIAMVGLGGIVAAIVTALRNPRVKEQLQAGVRQLPLVGDMLARAELGGWCRTVGVALLNKALLTDALRLGEGSATSPAFRRALERVRSDVRAGRALEEALAEAVPDFDPTVYDLIKTGRAAGSLGDMLVFAASLFEEEARERTKRITALAEPLAVAGIALIVGAIVVSIVMAMTSLYDINI
ncbi:MAG: type II secretion system F family protein [Pseudomonadota bacterium]